VSEAIEQCRRHLGVSEDGGPFAEAEVRRDDDAGSLVELAQQVEQQRPAGGAERQVAKLIEDDEIGMNEPRCDLPGLALVLFRFERVDEFDGGEEPDALAVMLNGLDANRCGQMRLARARSPYQDGVMRVLQELAAMKLAHQGLVDLAANGRRRGVLAHDLPLGGDDDALRVYPHADGQLANEAGTL